jgi:hypothetical protein
MEKVSIFDNKGNTFDRYTIILPDGDIFGASENPFHPQGFGQYCGNIMMRYNLGLNRKLFKNLFKSEIKSLIQNKAFGELVSIEDLPDNVKKYINQITE